MPNLTGKTAIITGASSGIGATIAIHLATEGANVILAARRKEKLTAVADDINTKDDGRALAVGADVSNRSDVEKLVKQATDAFGDIDIYVNNAGLMLRSVVQEGNVEDWEDMIDVNIKGVLYGINAVLPSMIKRSAGHIVNISSVSGHEVTKSSTVYSATKFASRALSMGLEKELARTGVRVTNISPGMVDTDLTASNKPKDRKPLETDDIAKAVVYAVTQPDYVNVNEITVRPV
ncbi:SDR family oxidoreductase [Virgibacillus sp. NKC19-16]|uniref:SDR family oxidoreductase n=1 Tax=Virgibacillus salidurans TaxID=2831673 RepID=UPI001F3F5C00|nr:SDR family oxidoreductase [Virgibacillus sp. NKC19-16]UJL47758.1 SDR family oxidoreductase [Virgibacillus sp. NKC19-16]